MEKLSVFCTNGDEFTAITEQNEVVTDEVSDDRFLEKVFPGYVFGDEYDTFIKQHPIGYGRIPLAQAARHENKNPDERHQWDISRRDHGDLGKLVADTNAWIEKEKEERKKACEEYQQKHDRLWEPFEENEDEVFFDIILGLTADEAEERQAA